jgi:hypothetical protein
MGNIGHNRGFLRAALAQLLTNGAKPGTGAGQILPTDARFAGAFWI